MISKRFTLRLRPVWRSRRVRWSCRVVHASPPSLDLAFVSACSPAHPILIACYHWDSVGAPSIRCSIRHVRLILVRVTSAACGLNERVTRAAIPYPNLGNSYHRNSMTTCRSRFCRHPLFFSG